jgi:uncharacterized membrane protein YjjB (DUF3815 family)
MNGLDLLGYVIQDAFWAAVAATGFAILFNVPRHALPGCALGAAIGHGTRALLMQLGMNIEVATLVGATVIGFLGMAFAQYFGAPTQIFTVSAAVTLVPGSFAYRTMIGILRFSVADPASSAPLLVDAASNGIRTAVILGAIAIGIAAPTLIFFRTKPVV